MELWFRIRRPSRTLPTSTVRIRPGTGNIGSLSAREVDVLVGLQERREAFDVLFNGPAGRISEAHFLRQAATQALVSEALSTARHERDRGSRDSQLHSSCLDLAIQLDPGVARRPLWLFYPKRTVAVRPSGSGRWDSPAASADGSHRK